MASKLNKERNVHIVILHAGPRPVDELLKEFFLKQQIACSLIRFDDFSNVNQFPMGAIFLNRVPPSSVFDAGYNAHLVAKSIVQDLCSAGVTVVNSLQATLADYSKLYSAELMIKHGVRTPRTFLIDEDLVRNGPPFIPAVVKLDTGGFGRGMKIIRSKNDWNDNLAMNFSQSTPQIVQEYIQSEDGIHICPLIMFQRLRGLSIRNLADEWIDKEKSKSITSYNLSDEVLELAIKATTAISAKINTVDMLVDKNGPIVIENNPTPAFTFYRPSTGGEHPIATFGQSLLDWLSSRETDT